MFNFFHTFHPSSLFFGLGFVSIHWYGLTMTLAVIAGFFVARFLFARYGFAKEVVYDLGFYLVIFGFLGARAYHVLNEIDYYWQHPLNIFAVWNGGLAFHGAVLVGLVVTYFYVKRNASEVCNLRNKKQETRKQTNFNNQSPKNKNGFRLYLVSCILYLADILTPALALGQSIGRWGNYFNQELYGMPCSFAWCIPISLENRIKGFESFTHFHPTFLYESLLSLIIFGVLVFLHMKRLQLIKVNQESGIRNQEKENHILPHVKQLTLTPGAIAAIYLMLYSLVRIGMELLRIDYTPLIFGIRLPILVSCIFILAAIIFLWHSRGSLRNVKNV